MIGIWRKLGRLSGLTCLGIPQSGVRLVWAVTNWERVSSSLTGWGTVEIANQNYFVVGVL